MEDYLKYLLISSTVRYDNCINIEKNNRKLISEKVNFKKQEVDNMLPVTIKQYLIVVIEYDTDNIKVDIYHDIKNPKYKLFIQDKYELS